MFISGGDIALAGIAIGGLQARPGGFATSIAAEDSLRQLGNSIKATNGERMQVSASAGAFGINLPAPTLRKMLAFLDTDLRFFRPRSFLINLLSSARQVKRLAPELARVFR
jgi:hypothetical protein